MYENVLGILILILIIIFIIYHWINPTNEERHYPDDF